MLLIILAGWPSGLRCWSQVPDTNILPCYKLTVLLAYNQFENNNIGRMAEWSKSHSCHATLLQIKSFNSQKRFEDNEQHSFNCIDYNSRMAEWSKALVSGTSHFDGVGSNPTPVMVHCYKLPVLLSWKQFENNKQHSFKCIDYIGRIAEWSKSHSFHAILLKTKSSDCHQTIEK